VQQPPYLFGFSTIEGDLITGLFARSLPKTSGWESKMRRKLDGNWKLTPVELNPRLYATEWNRPGRCCRWQPEDKLLKTQAESRK